MLQKVCDVAVSTALILRICFYSDARLWSGSHNIPGDHNFRRELLKEFQCQTKTRRKFII